MKLIDETLRFDYIIVTIVLLINILFVFGLSYANINSNQEPILLEHKIIIPISDEKIIKENFNPDLALYEDFESVDYYVVLARVTAYAPFDNQSGICADENPFVTSVGHLPSSKYIAVDPSRIPYGTSVFIPGYGLTIAGDTGEALRAYDGFAIDVFMDTYQEAIDFGVKYLEVKVYE